MTSNGCAAAIGPRSFIDSIGVNSHIDFANYGYRNLNTVAASINYLGLKNIRDSAQTERTRPPGYTSQKRPAQNSTTTLPRSPAGMATDLGYVTQLAQAGILNFLEGGNEEDDAYVAGLGNTLAITAQFQQQVYATGRSLGLPVINMSLGSGWTADNNWQGNYGAVGDLSAYTDYGNAHTYPNLGQGIDWSISGSRPRPTRRRLAPGDHLRDRLERKPGFPQADIAKYALNAAMDGIKDGDVKTYFYWLFDDGSGRFGLMNADGTPSQPAQRSTTSRRCWPIPARPHRPSPPPPRLHVERHDRQRQLDSDGEVGWQQLGVAVEQK